jgi:uncharacterized phosphatase
MMILQKEFYFLRHGQTEYNAKDIREDHPAHLPLNDTGRAQAYSVEPFIASLPVKKICCSPMKRAIETRNIAAARLVVEHEEIFELSECNAIVWDAMEAAGNCHHSLVEEPVKGFFNRVEKGINQALSSHDEPVLIVAHAGVHWALCSLLEITDHDWLIDNCVPVHFYPGQQGEWKAKKLALPTQESVAI